MWRFKAAAEAIKYGCEPAHKMPSVSPTLSELFSRFRVAEELSRGNARLLADKSDRASMNLRQWPPEGWTRKMLLSNLFKHCDDDNSGALSLSEFMQLFELEAAASQKTAYIKFCQADTGTPRRYSNPSLIPTPHGVASLLAVRAENKDNKLSKEEFVSYYEKHFSTYDDDHFLDVVSVMLDKAEASVVMDVAPAVITAPKPAEDTPPSADGEPAPVVLPAGSAP